MNKTTYAPFIARELKDKPLFYKGLRQKTDTSLHEQIASYISKEFGNKTLKILDWGAGEGALSEKLSDMGHIVTSADINDSEWRAKTPQFIALDFNNKEDVDKFLDQHIGAFDLVVCTEVIEHIESPWALLRSLRKLNCDVIITTPNVSSWWGRFWFLMTGDLWGFTQDGWKDPGHINPITSVEMRNIATDTGYEVKEIFLGGRLPIIWAYNLKRLIVSLIFLFIRPVMSGFRDGYILCYHIRPTTHR